MSIQGTISNYLFEKQKNDYFFFKIFVKPFIIENLIHFTDWYVILFISIDWFLIFKMSKICFLTCQDLYFNTFRKKYMFNTGFQYHFQLILNIFGWLSTDFAYEVLLFQIYLLFLFDQKFKSKKRRTKQQQSVGLINHSWRIDLLSRN